VKILALIITAYTPVMLLIHVSTGKMLKAWESPTGSWINRRFPPQRALRIEALYWLLGLAGWTLWPSAAWKAAVVVFATIHLGVWVAGEVHTIHFTSGSGPLLAQTRWVRLGIITFDLIEAVMLAAMWSLAAIYLMHPG
jgi:hypothetical protein